MSAKPASPVIALLPSSRCRLSIWGNASAGHDLWDATTLDCDLTIGFAPPPASLTTAVDWREIDATTRMTWPTGARRVALVGLQSLSSLGPLMLWDLAHGCPVGGEILLVDREAALADTPLDRAYYNGWMTEADRPGPGRRLFRKIALSPVEGEAGLDRWTFALPMDRPNPEVIARLVTRIGELGLAAAEILVACPPENGTGLPPGVGTVPTAPGTTLSAKKNALAEAASHPNLCIFHDRLLPPRNFRQAVEAFGDAYPLTGFQNLLINPRDGAISRYSDYHAEFGPGADQLVSASPDGRETHRPYDDLLDLRQSWRSSFVEASIHEYSPNFYLTGSLYLAKRSVWRLCGQNEAIDWARLEDVEFGHRALGQFGIPMRINPFGFARTERIRPVVSEGARHHGKAAFEDHDLRPGPAAFSLATASAPTVFGITEGGYRERLLAFCGRWVSPMNLSEARRQIALTRLGDTRDLGKLLITVLYLCEVRRSEADLRSFLQAFSGDLLMSAMDRAAETGIVGRVMQERFLVDELIRSSYLTDLLLVGEKRPLFLAPALLDDDLLTARLLDVWRDDRHGLGFGGTFPEFVAAVKAAI